MLRTFLFRSSLVLFLFLLGSCTIDVSQSTPPPAPISIQTSAPIGNLPTPEATPTFLDPAHLPQTRLPVTWSALKLSGRLVFINDGQPSADPILSVESLDLATGVKTTLYQSPPATWVYSLAVSPDEKQLVMGYATWDNNGNPSSGTLYQMPMDASSQPSALIPTIDFRDQYSQPDWSPDGKYLYFSHVNYSLVPPNQPYPDMEVMRMTYPGGKLEKIADQGFWPRLSSDGTRLVYIHSDIQTGKNTIFVTDPDGKNAHQLSMIGPTVPDIIDAPIFTPDGQSILFSAPVPAKSSAPTWLEQVLGIGVVDAHNVPSEWWRMPVSGGAVTQLTNLQYAGLFASIAPDGKHIASFSTSGIFVMNPDASGITMIFSDLGGVYSTISWLP